MAITVLSKTPPLPVPGGQLGFYRQSFVCQWSTTDITGTVPSGMRKVLRVVGGFTYLSEPSEGEVMYVSSTNDGNGVTLDSGQVITLGRISLGPTSGLKFGFTTEGYV